MKKTMSRIKFVLTERAMKEYEVAMERAMQAEEEETRGAVTSRGGNEAERHGKDRLIQSNIVCATTPSRRCIRRERLICLLFCYPNRL